MRTVEDTYALTPLQQGMLFHGLRDRRAGAYLVQMVCTFVKDLNVPAFRLAWERVVARHPILRTGFRWEGLDEPLQEVHSRVELPLEAQDWRGLSAQEQGDRLDAYLRDDRTRGFDLGQAPLFRLALFRAGEDGHRFVWTFHHILLDGRSVLDVLKEVSVFYDAFCQGRDLQRPLPRPYRDHVEWVQRQDLRRAETHWRGLLRGFASPTPLTVAPPQECREGRGGQELRLSASATAALQGLAREHGITLNTALQGAWALLLSRYSGEEDVVFGAVRACRHSTVEGAESMIGLLLNTLPVRVRVPPDAVLLPWLKDLRAQHLAVRAFENTPLVKVQEWSDAPAGVPLFESVVMFENYEWDALLRTLEGGLAYREVRFIENPSYPITVAGHAAPEFLVKINYDRGRFDEPTVARMLGHLRTLLEGIASAPHRPLVELPMLTEEERRQLLVAWNRTEAETPRERCVHRLFEAWSGRTPGALAVAGGGRRLTYGELNARANRLAHRLRALGVGPEVPVGICLEPSPEAVVGMLGALKAGGAYVPLDPEDAHERLTFMLRDTRVPALLTRRGLLPKLPESAARVICLDEEPGMPGAANPDAQPGHLAYIIYTSGSTGAPKGVEVLHAGLANLVAWHQRAYGVTPADRASQVARLAFDASVWEIWPYLTAGASVHIPDRETRMSPGRVLAWLAAERITLSFLPTPLAEAAMEEAWPEDLALRALFTGGDRLRRVPRKAYPFRIVNHYGPTEYTVVTTCAQVSPEDREPPIGRPIANTRVYVLDAHRRPVPVGAPGELYIGGDGLSRGYLHRPELTAERFVPDPFGASPDARLYRTGDRVRYRPDGNLEFLGRMDQQVKIRGFRVELGEIEAALVRHAGVREAAVVAREGVSGQRLVAYMVAGGVPPGPDELRAFLQEKLPAYMAPQAFVFLDSLPLTANGKVDRRGLPAPDDSGVPASAPRSPVEKALAAVWADVLGVERVGIHDNFFELGGHSLLATRLISRLCAEFWVELPLQTLFDAPTVAELALAITRRRAGETDQEGLERLLAELEGLSDEEAEQYVARETGVDA
ncbi:MAG: hypothetical protein A3F84_17975 [Candidatus Handelsmanbacteria bacterium RIFCSPLOWO2_12_FULL_64_10]|uniref:Carrier domain-containing protein n=1 Tax=Handelsmanbacteria sp. (strain RIFCSPLOWO2_12_FULL_64_10) TaxID=1817868 RepID=A0A1F6CSJ9_HANXR|nr:MAG: hypothetical protein A3F84_17975 [Candidatus Handelsmanbacteria bacterium RIFCSPLOWO2_12_FULL_64_10]